MEEFFYDVDDSSQIEQYFDDSTIIDSVHESSEFFNIDNPAVIQESVTTGVYPGNPLTERDDILIVNRSQLDSIGITDKEGLDLVMTHEAAHRALQGMGLDFSSHEEELCCDYMSGVRAGLNNMDASKMGDSLLNTQESLSHPSGTDRAGAIERGEEFARDYYANHGCAPSLSECIEDFSQNVINEHGLITLRNESSSLLLTSSQNMFENEVLGEESLLPDNEEDDLKEFINNRTSHLGGASDVLEQDVQEFHHGGQYGDATGDYIDGSRLVDNQQTDFKGFVDDREWHIERAKNAQENAEWHEKRANDAVARGDLSAAKDHASRAASYRKQEQDCIAASKKCTK